MTAVPRPAPLLPPHRLPRGLLAIIATCVLAEAVLAGADGGLWGSARWRPLAYQYGAFWAGLLHGWRPNYAAQPLAMFLSHGFLHGGPGHMAGNMLVLASLGRMAAARLGAGGFAQVYLAGLLGGGVAFGLLATSPAPMVGASGAIFGLAGGWIVWTWRDRRAAGRATGLGAAAVLLWGVLALAGFNLAMWWMLDGILAWETHLGGTLAGAAMALALTGRRR